MHAPCSCISWEILTPSSSRIAFLLTTSTFTATIVISNHHSCYQHPDANSGQLRSIAPLQYKLVLHVLSGCILHCTLKKFIWLVAYNSCMPCSTKDKLSVGSHCVHWCALDQVANPYLMYQHGLCGQGLKETAKTDVGWVAFSTAAIYGKCWSTLYQAMLEVTSSHAAVLHQFSLSGCRMPFSFLMLYSPMHGPWIISSSCLSLLA